MFGRCGTLLTPLAVRTELNQSFRGYTAAHGAAGHSVIAVEADLHLIAALLSETIEATPPSGGKRSLGIRSLSAERTATYVIDPEREGEQWVWIARLYSAREQGAGVMPCFYLHIRCDSEFIEDDEGFDFEDISAAGREAVRSIRSLACGDVQGGVLNLDLSIEIWDRERHLETIRFDDAIQTIAKSNPGPYGAAASKG